MAVAQGYVALLGATTKGLLNDLPTLGFLFESLVVRDLRLYAESFEATVTHNQDYADREDDVVVVPITALGP